MELVRIGAPLLAFTLLGCCFSKMTLAAVPNLWQALCWEGIERSGPAPLECADSSKGVLTRGALRSSGGSFEFASGPVQTAGARSAGNTPAGWR